MRKTYPLIATADEIKSLAERAFAIFAVLEAPYNDDDDGDYTDARRLARRQVHAALETLRFCASAAGLLGDTSLLPLVRRILERLVPYKLETPNDKEPVYEGLTFLLEAGAPIDKDIEALARHRDIGLRVAVAKGLSPNSERAIALLERLSGDPNPAVRTPARRALEKAREVPWWAGKFQRDPLALLSAEEAERHKPTFERITALLDDPHRAQNEKLSELPALAASLPDAIVVDLCETTLSARGFYVRVAPALGTLMISRAGGAEALVRLCKQWSRSRELFGLGDEARMLIDAPIEHRKATCDVLIRFATEQPEKARLDQLGPAHIAASFAGQGYPPGVDLNPLLDLLLGMPEPPEYEIDWVFTSLDDALEAEGADPSSVLERVVEARLQGYPGPWKRLWRAGDSLLARAPYAVKRQVAEDALRRDDEATVRWGLERLLFELHDPERDPPLIEMARRFWDEPRYRAQMAKSDDLRATMVSWQRAALRRGELGFVAAAHTLGAVSRFWGGIDTRSGMRVSSRVEDFEAKRQAERERFAAFLGPEELRGPVTEAEWAELRRVRASCVLESHEEFSLALGTLPEGRYQPEDRALLDIAFERLEKDDDLAFSLGSSLALHALESDLPLFDRIGQLCPEARGLLRYFRSSAREDLGLPSRPEGEEEEAKGDEWMDEPDDEDESDEDES